MLLPAHWLKILLRTQQLENVFLFAQQATLQIQEIEHASKTVHIYMLILPQILIHVLPTAQSIFMLIKLPLNAYKYALQDTINILLVNVSNFVHTDIIQIQSYHNV